MSIKLEDIKLLPVYPGSGAPERHLEEFERFLSACDNVRNPSPVMLELGCFWALWTIVFGKRFPNAELIVLEGNQDKLAVGLANLMNNGLSAKAHFNTINVECSRSKPEFGELVEDTTLQKIFEVNNIKAIDLLHMDIQGSEEGLYFEVFEYIRKGLIHNVIMGTHSEELDDKILTELASMEDLVTVSAIPFRPGIGDGEITIKRRY